MRRSRNVACIVDRSNRCSTPEGIDAAITTDVATADRYWGACSTPEGIDAAITCQRTELQAWQLCSTPEGIDAAITIHFINRKTRRR